MGSEIPREEVAIGEIDRGWWDSIPEGRRGTDQQVAQFATSTVQGVAQDGDEGPQLARLGSSQGQGQGQGFETVTILKSTYTEACDSMLKLEDIARRQANALEALRAQVRLMAQERQDILGLLMQLTRQRNTAHYAWKANERRMQWGARWIWWLFSSRARKIEREEYAKDARPRAYARVDSGVKAWADSELSRFAT